MWRDELNTISFNNYADWPLAVRIFSALMVLIIVLSLGYLFFIAPQLNKIQHRKTEEYNLLQQWASLAPKVQSIGRHRSQINNIKAIFSDVLNQLQNNESSASILDNISQVGSQSGINITSLKPLEKKQQQYYIESPLFIEAVGSYHQLADFISKLANLKQFMTFQNLVITTPSYSEKNDNKLQLQLKIIFYHGEV